MDSPILVALVSVVGGIFAALATALISRRFGLPTDLEEKLVERLKRYNDEVEEENTRLQTRITALEDSVEAEKAEVMRLEKRVDDLERQNRRQQKHIDQLEGR